MANEKILNKHCFIRKKSNRRAYCSKCGKIVYQDEYNLNRHAKECGFHENDFIRIYDENQEFVAAFRMYDGYMTFFVFTPVLELRPGFQDRYRGGKWKEVYRCSFFIKRKRMVENGLQDLDYWVSYFDEREIVLLNEKSLYEIMYENLFLPGIQSLSMFVKIFKGKGFQFEEVLEQNQVSGILAKKIALPTEKEENPYITRWKFHGRIDGYLVPGKEETKPALKLQVTIYKEEKTYQIVMTENCFYADKELDLRTLLWYSYYLDIKESDLEYFDQCYPSLGLMNYLRAGGRNLLIPLFAAKYDAPLELLAKSGCIVLADNYYTCLTKSKLVDPDGKNLKELFGAPASILRKLDEESLDIENLFHHLYSIRLAAPEFLQVEKLTICNMLFLTRNEVPGPLLRRKDIHGYRHFTKKARLQMTRYLGTKHYRSDYRLYMDYMNMCYTNENYIRGYTPDFLEEAHDAAMSITRYRTNQAQEVAFEKRVHEEDYISLTSQYGDEAELFSEDGYVVYAPEKAYDLIREGRKLHHCVGSYIDRVIHGSSQIYFLRMKEDDKSPYATIEVDGEQVVQVKAACNERACQSAQQFVRKWAKIKHLGIRTTDLLVTKNMI